MLCCNITGTHKLPPVFINKYKNPRCLHNINKETFPVWYYWNSTAWMQCSIFQKWIKHVNQLMRIQKKHILLLMDNASSHQLEENQELSNIKLHFLPPNTTSHLQPIDQGIIHSFKVIIFLLINLSLKIFYFIYFIYLFIRHIIKNYYVKIELKHLIIFKILIGKFLN